MVFNLDDIRTIFQGKYPKRPTLEALKQYRRKKISSCWNCTRVVFKVSVQFEQSSQFYFQIYSNGDEWYKMRQHIHVLLKSIKVHSFWNRQQVVAEEFSKSFLAKRNGEGVIKDFIQEQELGRAQCISSALI